MDIVFIGLVIIVLYLLWKNHKLGKALEKLEFEKQSYLVKHGKQIEQLFPFFKHYKYDPSNFRFIGSPIDGIQFERDKIVFVEFKTGASKLTTTQERIKDIVNKKKIKFEEIRI